MIAFTEIRHGKEDGSVVVIKEGETVKGLPADVVKDLKEQGLVGDKVEVQAAENEELSKKNEELSKKNEELKAQVESLQELLASQKQDTPPATPSK